MQSNATHSRGQAAPQTEPPSQHWEPAAEGAAAAADGNEIDQISVARSMNLRRSDQLVWQTREASRPDRRVAESCSRRLGWIWRRPEAGSHGKTALVGSIAAFKTAGVRGSPKRGKRLLEGRSQQANQQDQAGHLHTSLRELLSVRHQWHRAAAHMSPSPAS